ncbi:unnamed protein product [Protopolystoma xenopodis]|uniref:Uncharacterized protein n=1 Tax=Protopolystoma xenopodis TaxID=117903 RepID=A0A3S4ZU86_9PLAT|nr:unnamed protein product [Protopolystoma xenopodis]
MRGRSGRPDVVPRPLTRCPADIVSRQLGCYASADKRKLTKQTKETNQVDEADGQKKRQCRLPQQRCASRADQYDRVSPYPTASRRPKKGVQPRQRHMHFRSAYGLRHHVSFTQCVRTVEA